MLNISKENIAKIGEIVTRRIDAETFFGEGVLNYFVEMSGGCPRQLLRITNRALVISLGKKIEMENARKSTHELGQQMLELLDSEHLEILRNDSFHEGADPKTLDLLFSLAVLKYNGDRLLNPLLESLVGPADAPEYEIG